MSVCEPILFENLFTINNKIVTAIRSNKGDLEDRYACSYALLVQQTHWLEGIISISQIFYYSLPINLLARLCVDERMTTKTMDYIIIHFVCKLCTKKLCVVLARCGTPPNSLAFFVPTLLLTRDLEYE